MRDTPDGHKALQIIESLLHAPLLIGDIPEAAVFDRGLFGEIPSGAHLRFDQKLGHLYEQALQVLIDASPALRSLASHIQIFDDDRRTIGELDFLLHDTVDDRHIHLELAVKFYMAVKREGVWHFPGPNSTDNWHRKLKRMREHQFCLGQRRQAKALMQERFGIEHVEAQQLIYGCFFFPAGCEDPPAPPFMAAHARTGRWLFAREWDLRFADVDEVLVIPKPLWPVRFSHETSSILDTVHVSDLRATADDRCVMFIFKDAPEQPWFIVPDHWGGAF